MIESAAQNNAFENSVHYFASPWHAELCAIAVLLCDAGHLDRTELSEVVEQAISSANPVNGVTAGEEYFAATLGALELALAERGMASRREIDSVQGELRRAYLATPHGAAVRL